VKKPTVPSLLIESMVKDYAKAGFHFVRIRRVDGKPSKGPRGTGWNLPKSAENPEGYTDNAQQAMIWLKEGDNLGLALQPSGVVSLDIDDLEATLEVLHGMGLPLLTWLEADDSVEIRSGKEGKAKLLFRVPEGETMPSSKKLNFGKGKDAHSVFELRHASAEGKTLQDVLPPSIHPDTGEPYQKVGNLFGMPTIPSQLLSLWRSWPETLKTFDPAYEPPAPATPAKPKAAPTGGERNPIAEFNEGHSLTALLESHGYQRKGKRYLRPGSESGIPAVTLLTGQDGRELCYSHGGDALNDGKAHDTFDVYRILACGGDLKRALGWSESINAHNRALRQRPADTDAAKPAASPEPGLASSAETPAPLPKTAVRKEYQPPGKFVCESDEGKLKLVIESKGAMILKQAMEQERFAYDNDAASWHKWNGYCWAALPTPAEPERFILRTLFEGTYPLGFKQAYFNGVTSIMLRAGLLSLPPEPVGKIPFKNGLLDPDTRQLHPLSPDTAATWAIPHDYSTDAECPLFMAWIRSATGGDEGLIQLLRAFINACLNGRADLQKFLHLIGPGGTGKSTLIRLLFAILGPSNCVTTDLKQLELNRFETAALYGKRLTAITDTDKYGGSVNVLKALTGQDPVRNEKKNVQMGGTFTYGGMVVLASNEPLASTDYTSGLDRRRLVVPIDRRIPPYEKAEFLAKGGEDRLHEEIPAIVNWALQLSRNEVTRLFMHPPRKATDAAFEALTAQNPIADWINECLVPAPKFWIGIGVNIELRTPEGRTYFEDADAKLYPNFLTWCKENKKEALSMRRFRHAAVDMLRTLGAEVIELRKDIGQGIQGVRLRVKGEDLYPWGGPARMQDGNLQPTAPAEGMDAPETQQMQEMLECRDFPGNPATDFPSAEPTDPDCRGIRCADCARLVGETKPGFRQQRCTASPTPFHPDPEKLRDCHLNSYLPRNPL